MTGADEKGHPFQVRPYRPGDFQCLLDMYDLFAPKGRFQGMPPKEFGTLGKWVGMLIRDGENVLAWRRERVIGHVVLLPDFEKKDAEYLIFVNRPDRGKGIGTKLTQTALQWAEKLGLKTVWLTVDAYNFRAIRLYRKFNFSFCEAYESPSERLMKYRCGSDDGT
jgi:RimJ/RimL family protein N-acetyltransferase